MKTLKKILIAILLILAVLFVFIELTWNKKFEAPYPQLKASTDSAVIARGRYLAYGPAHCASCHVPMDKAMEVEKGNDIPMSGGWELSIPPGTFRAPNLTPDKETGIGNYTDADLARTLRYMVNKNGHCVFPFMPFAEMSDEDLVAVISFIRSQPAVKHEVEKSKLSFLGKALMTFGVIKPEGTIGTPPKAVKIDSTIEYGNYIANYIANCRGCHTNRDLKTGEFIGKPFAGGFVMPDESPTGEAGVTFVTPNLTPDPQTGHIYDWTEQQFIDRFKKGRVHEKSPMPWGSFARMNDLELKAVYRYLRSLKA
ncbi:MAG: cytochrome c [Niabella sp.]|nr:MAG: cytochrome c [Niabella sp.]